MKIRYTPEFDQHAQGYHDHLDQVLKKWGKTSSLYTAKAKIRQLLPFVEQRQTSSEIARVLDVGCGTGLIAGLLKDRRLRLYGVDLSQSMIVHNRMKADVDPQFKFLVSSATRLPFVADSFDFTFAVCVFHHLSDKERLRTVQEMKRVTKPSRLIFIFEHNPLNPITQLVVKCCPLDRNARLLFPYQVRKLYQRADLETVKQKYFLFFPEFLSFLNRFEPCLGSIPLGAQYFVTARKP